jgi:hypothetical protein
MQAKIGSIGQDFNSRKEICEEIQMSCDRMQKRFDDMQNKLDDMIKSSDRMSELAE